MNAFRKLTRIVAVGALALAIGALTPAFGQGHSGGGGHSSGGGGGHSGGSAHFAGGSHFSGGTHFAARYYGGGFHGGGYYGTRGGYYGHGGYNGGYWHGGFYGPRFGYGWFLPVLPAFYATYWWGGIPYYYANDAYYTWSPNYNGYVATDPPAGAADASDSAAQAPATSGQTYNYPKNGQTDEQQATDRYQCHQWAVSQSGYDPTRSGAAAAGGQQMDYQRAITACLEGRGYSVR
jgi:hypothetical protein